MCSEEHILLFVSLLSILSFTTAYPTVFLLVFFQAEAEIQVDAVAPGQKVLLIDDLLATGGEKSPG